MERGSGVWKWWKKEHGTKDETHMYTVNLIFISILDSHPLSSDLLGHIGRHPIDIHMWVLSSYLSWSSLLTPITIWTDRWCTIRRCPIIRWIDHRWGWREIWWLWFFTNNPSRLNTDPYTSYCTTFLSFWSSCHARISYLSVTAILFSFLWERHAPTYYQKWALFLLPVLQSLVGLVYRSFRCRRWIWAWCKASLGAYTLERGVTSPCDCKSPGKKGGNENQW